MRVDPAATANVNLFNPRAKSTGSPGGFSGGPGPSNTQPLGPSAPAGALQPAPVLPVDSTAESGGGGGLGDIGLGSVGGGVFPSDYIPSLEGFQVAMDWQDLTYDRNHDGMVSIADALVLIQELAAAAAAAAEEETDVDEGEPSALHAAAPPAGSLTAAPSAELELGKKKLAELAGDVFSKLQGAGAGTKPPVVLQQAFDTLPISGTDKDFLSRTVQKKFDDLASKSADRKATEIAATLQKRFEAAGFAERPPINTPQVVQSLELPADIESALMQKLAEHYKEGLGISLYT